MASGYLMQALTSFNESGTGHVASRNLCKEVSSCTLDNTIMCMSIQRSHVLLVCSWAKAA